MTREAARPGFVVVHGNRLEDLRDLVIELLRATPPAPLVPELFLVQSNGMKHWLEQSLAADDALGICAATRVELPSAFLWQAYRAVLGADAVPARLPLDEGALTWRLLRLLPALATRDEAFAPLRGYLDAAAVDALPGDGERASPELRALRTLQLAQQVADVFDGYQQYRADWLGDWERGVDQLQRPGRPPAAVPAPQSWQPRLWRALLADLGERGTGASRAAVHREFEARMQAWPPDAQRPAAIPPRIIVFGISALPMQSVRALAELGRFAQVLFVVQNPCRHYWGHVVEGRELLGARVRHRQRHKRGLPVTALPTDAAALHVESHPLLASWGRQGRDYLHLLDEFDQAPARPDGLRRVDAFTSPLEPSGTSASTRLQRLQAGILELDPPPPQPEPCDDDSIEFVTAHSAQREVEVLHDRILAWLDADPSLRPRDIMVMVPDVGRFAPHVQAVFGRFAPDHARHVPFSIADASPRRLPLVQAFEQLLRLGDSRVTVADWLTLFEVPAVRRRFRLAEADVAQLRDWVVEAGVRWGLHAAHRTRWGLAEDLQDASQNTWRFGIDRLLLGYATGSEGAWRGVLPFPAAGGIAAQAVGQLAEWLDAIETTLRELAVPRTPAEWVPVLTSLLQRFLDPVDEADERVVARLLSHLHEWTLLCRDADLDEPLPLAVVREHWLAEVEVTGLRQRFFGGGVQFATLMPMRSIPFRVVCLLGMNEADYPRRVVPRDFDLMAVDWRPGDRSRREDDRYLFLEAVLSARQRLYVSWEGRRATDNAEMPPSVVVAQLRDELARRFAPGSPEVLQPLQPFSPRYFAEGSPFRTYDADWSALQGGSAAASRALVATGEDGVPAACPDELALEDLERLLRHPVEVFWRNRLRVAIDSPDASDAEDEPFELDELAEFRAVERLLEAAARPDPTAPTAATAPTEALRLAGALPLAARGTLVAERLRDKAARVLERAEPWQAAHPLVLDPVPIELQVGGVRIRGGIAGLRAGAPTSLQLALRGGAVTHGARGRHRPRHDALLALWVRQVAAAAAGLPVTTVLCGFDAEVHVDPPTQADAVATLGGWLEVWRAAWAAPLPLACRTACAWLTAEDPDDDEPLRLAFEGSGSRNPGDLARSAYLRRSVDGYDERVAASLRRWARPLYGALVAAARPVDAADAEDAGDGADP